MADRNEENSTEELHKAQKAALLMISLGQQWATEIMRLMKPDEVKSICYWISQVDYVPQELTEKVIREFYESMARKTSLASTGGRAYIMSVLGGMMGENKAKELVDDIVSQEETEVFRILKKVDPKQLASHLKQEQPQTIALMMSYLEPSRAAAIISEFPMDSRSEIVLRLAKLEETDPDVIGIMEDALQESLGPVASGKQMKKIGGIKVVAEILNNTSKHVEKQIMEEISEQDFDLATEIKDLMFVFEDMVLLDDKSIQTVLKDVDQADLVMALKGSSDAVKDKVFKNISKRQVDGINDELAFLGPVKSSTVFAAQQKIINVIRKLDEEGKVLIQGKGGGGDDIIG